MNKEQIIKSEKQITGNREQGTNNKGKRFLTLLFVTCYLLVVFTACDNSIDTPKTQKPVENGYGKISIGFTGEMAHQDAPPQSARTVLPSTVFDKYVYTFTKAGGTTGIVKAPDDDGFFTLEVGSYTVAVQAYIGTKEPYTLAASGVSPQFSVGPGSNAPVRVPLSEVAAATVGKFSYTITWPAGSTAEITLQKWPELNTIALNPVNVTQGNGKTQTLELGAGSYLLTVLVSKSGLYAGISEAVRIYPSLSTVYTKDFVDDDLLQIVAPILTLTEGNTKITYTWTASYPVADSYDVYWKVGSGLTAASVKTGTKITGASSGGEITGLTNGTAYSVIVTANKAGNSVDSTVRTGTPSLATFITAPILTLTAGNGSLRYTWTASNPVADSYDVYWKAGDSLNAADVKTGTKITGASSGGNISGLTNDTAYSMVVTANKAGYNSIDSVVRTGTPVQINAVQPVISTQPQGGAFLKTGTLSVTASVTDGGTLSYQWYRNVTGNTSGGTAIIGATGSSYTLSDIGTYYYYVIVTNTIANNGDGGTKTATITSRVAEAVTVLVLTEWARTVSAGSDESWFSAVAVDSSGNVYAAGGQNGKGTYTYGTGVSAQGTNSNFHDNIPFMGNNVVLVKYNSSGTALWARTVSTGVNDSGFSAVAVDSSGNVYAAGSQNGNGTYTYGTGVSAQGANSTIYGRGSNAVLVKYNSSGTALWARTVSTGDNDSGFSTVAVDSSGNVYAAGSQSGNGTYTYGTGVSAQGTCSGSNVVLVKYNSNGTALWARTVSTGDNGSGFSAVAVDTSGNVYAAGSQRGAGTYTYGTGVSAQGTYSDRNVVLVKYNSSGTALWARTVIRGGNDSIFSAVAVDSSGGVYAAGFQWGTGTFTYDTGVSLNGAAGGGTTLVKYDSSGNALWAQIRVDGLFTNIAIDSSGNMYMGLYSDIWYGLVKYNSSGTEQWVRKRGTTNSAFREVTADSSGNVYAAGYLAANETFTCDTGESIKGAATGLPGSSNVLLVKYKQ